MKIPEPLADLIRESLAAMEHHPRHHLRSDHRERILAAMGPRSSSTSPRLHEGNRRRALLAITCAERALPVWESVWPRHRFPHQIIEHARRGLDREGRPGEADWKLIEDAWVRGEEASLKSFLAGTAGLSAVSALRTVLLDEGFDPEMPSDPREEEETEQDAASLAALALSQGSPANPASDPAKRLAFWEWYLTEAVPAAYRDGSLPPRNEGDS